jgi:hypothetical protein
LAAGEWWVLVMKRVLAVVACGMSLGACSSFPSWMQFDTPAFMRSAPAATTMQFESEPSGAEARTSLGQSCRTPCSVAVTGTDFSVSFSLPGYQPQTVPVRVAEAADGGEARLVPNPVFVELQSGAPPPPMKKPPPPRKRKPKVAARPAATTTAGPTAMAPQPAPSPAPAPASPWPPAR